MNRIINGKASSKWRGPLEFLLLAGLVIGTGCHKATKDQTAAPSPEVTTQQANDHMPLPAQSQPVTTAPATQSNGQPDLAELDRSLLRWIMSNRRPPKNFEDFAATAGVPIPPPPPGKKYIIASDMHIKLVNQ